MLHLEGDLYALLAGSHIYVPQCIEILGVLSCGRVKGRRETRGHEKGGRKTATSLGAWGPFTIPLLAMHSPVLLWVTDSSAVDNAEAVSKSVFQITLRTSSFIILIMVYLYVLLASVCPVSSHASISSRVPAAGSSFCARGHDLLAGHLPTEAAGSSSRHDPGEPSTPAKQVVIEVPSSAQRGAEDRVFPFICPRRAAFPDPGTPLSATAFQAQSASEMKMALLLFYDLLTK